MILKRKVVIGGLDAGFIQTFSQGLLFNQQGSWPKKINETLCVAGQFDTLFKVEVYIAGSSPKDFKKLVIKCRGITLFIAATLPFRGKAACSCAYFVPT